MKNSKVRRLFGVMRYSMLNVGGGVGFSDAFGNDPTSVILGGVAVLFLSAIVLRLVLSYSASGVKLVDCWFCGHELRVPRVEANSFRCPSCDQYNGFKSDGDYNVRIPEQYDASLNPSLTSRVSLSALNFTKVSLGTEAIRHSVECIL